MSNPYIQFELDAAKKAPLLASALGIQLREAVGGLTLMWLHIYGSGKGDEVNAFFLRVFFGVDGAVAGEALVELGFVEPIDANVWRVRGASRYTRLSEKRAEAGRKGADSTNAKRSANAAAKPRDGSAIAEESSANGRQTVGKTDERASLPRKTVGKTPENDVLPRQSSANGRQTAENGRQKAALDPRSEISSLSGKRDLGDREFSARARKAGPPPDGGQPTHALETSKPPLTTVTLADLPEGWTEHPWGFMPPNGGSVRHWLGQLPPGWMPEHDGSLLHPKCREMTAEGKELTEAWMAYWPGLP